MPLEQTDQLRSQRMQGGHAPAQCRGTRCALHRLRMQTAEHLRGEVTQLTDLTQQAHQLVA